ncbi:MAG TPA: hypothetical protein DIC42_03270, partial [Holosporales bacterium]|nr:hypothetical protein [Holosporales bacterium]
SEAASETGTVQEKTKQQRIDEFNAKADKVANSLIDFLTPKSTRGTATKGMGIEDLVKGATAAIKKAYAISQNIQEAVEAGIQYFKDNWDSNELGELPEQDLRNKLTDDLEEKQEPKAATKPRQSKSGKLTDVEVGVIREVLDKPIDAKQFPTFFDMNKVLVQETAKTQGEGQDRTPLDGTYVQAHLADLRSISLNNARILQDALGKDWKEKLIGFLEDNPTAGNIAQVSGLLNVINTDIYNEIAASKNGTEISKLKDLQARADRITYDTSRSASLALNQRRMYQDFGQGKDVADILSAVILTPEQQAMKSKVEEALKQKFTDEELNKPKTPKPKKQQQAKPKKAAPVQTEDSVKKDLISKGKKAAQQTDADGNVTIVSLKDKINQANEALNGFKC